MNTINWPLKTEAESYIHSSFCALCRAKSVIWNAILLVGNFRLCSWTRIFITKIIGLSERVREKEREITYSTSIADLNSINKLDLKQPAAEWNEKLLVKRFTKNQFLKWKTLFAAFLFFFRFFSRESFSFRCTENQSAKWFIEKNCNVIKCWSMKRKLSVQFFLLLSTLHHLHVLKRKIFSVWWEREKYHFESISNKLYWIQLEIFPYSMIWFENN